jgi:hypothetical protein
MLYGELQKEKTPKKTGKYPIKGRKPGNVIEHKQRKEGVYK